MRSHKKFADKLQIICSKFLNLYSVIYSHSAFVERVAAERSSAFNGGLGACPQQANSTKRGRAAFDAVEPGCINTGIACQYVSNSYNRNSQKISYYKIKIHFRVNSIVFGKKKDYTNYEGKLTVWFLICQEVAKMDEAKMVLSYNKLWKMLIDRKLKKKDLQKMTHLSSSVIAKMGRDESVHLDTIVKICIALQCNISDIVELQRKEA